MLQKQFQAGEEVVTANNYLTLQDHWRAIIDNLFEVAECRNRRLTHDKFTIKCVDLRYRGNGEVVGDGPWVIRIARVNANHFIPLFKYHFAHS